MSPVRVAVDAMGGDRGPEEIVAGALEAAADGIVPIIYGPAALDTHGLEHVVAEQVIAMDEKPAEAVRAKPDSSLVAACRSIAEGPPTRSSPPGTRARCSPPACSRSGGCRA